MLQASFQVVERWPQEPTRSREKSLFKSSYTQTLDLLERELFIINAKEVVIRLWLTPREIRNDGLPRADARPSQPGVILEFTTRHGRITMPCDTFTTWQDNLRALALSLEALRKVDRYGCSKKGQQYTGWKQLGAGERMPAFATVESAAEYIASGAGEGQSPDLIMRYTSEFKSAYKRAAVAVHPDTHPGDELAREAWDQLQDAAAILKKHHGLK